MNNSVCMVYRIETYILDIIVIQMVIVSHNINK